MNRHDYYCLLDDEPKSRQYHVRLTYELEGHDPGDWTTPPCSAEFRLAELVVLQAREFDSQGNIAALELQDSAAAHHDRAWQLVHENAELLDRLEEAKL